jgi:hypothetical protein
MMKIEGSGSISQRNGSADSDPDPHQNIMDPQHWLPPPVPPCRGWYSGWGVGRGAATDLLQLIGEALLAGELVLLQGEQQLLVVLHRVPTQRTSFYGTERTENGVESLIGTGSYLVRRVLSFR